MKKVMAIIVTLIFIISFAGCKKDTTNENYNSSDPESRSAITEDTDAKDNNQLRNDNVQICY